MWVVVGWLVIDQVLKVGRLTLDEAVLCSQAMVRQPSHLPRVEVRVQLVVPSSVRGELCWERIKARNATHIGLHTHSKQLGGADGARQLLNSALVPSFQSFIFACSKFV